MAKAALARNGSVTTCAEDGVFMFDAELVKSENNSKDIFASSWHRVERLFAFPTMTLFSVLRITLNTGPD